MHDSQPLPALIEEEKQARQLTELQDSFERSLEQVRYQALLLNNVRDAVVVWDTQGKITYTNPAAQLLFGWSWEEWLEMPAEVYLNSFTPPLRIPLREGTGGLRRERQFNHRNGTPIWVSSHVYALRDPNASGRLMGYMDVCRNITENKEMEAHVQAVQTQLIHAARLAAIGELASGVAHHINNPLTTIIAEAQILLHTITPDHPAHDSAEAIETAGWRVQKAVQRLLDFSRPAADMIESLDVNETIISALELVGDQIRASGVQIHVEFGEGLPRVQGNARQLVELWLNLLMLAHWSGIDGKPHCIGIRSSAPTGHSVQVEISDNGEPVKPDKLGTLFELSVNQNPRGRGTGVELALCQEIVRKHRGQITAEIAAVESVAAETAANDVTILQVSLPSG